MAGCSFRNLNDCGASFARILKTFLDLLPVTVFVPSERNLYKLVLYIAISFVAVYLLFPSLAKARFIDGRHVYMRGERVSLEFQTATEYVLFDVGGWLTEYVKVADGIACFTIDTGLLRSADYDVRAIPLKRQAEDNSEKAFVFPMTIAPVANPQRFPVWNWGGVPKNDLPYWTQRGFNGFGFASLKAPLEENDKRTNRLECLLEEGAKSGSDIGLNFHPLTWKGWAGHEDVWCQLPTGRRVPKKAYPLEKKVIDHAQKTVRSWMERFAAYPAFRHAHLSSEYVTPFCINEAAETLAKLEAGIDLKEYLSKGFIQGRMGRLDLKLLPESMMPENGIVADDNPIYRMLSWWWQRGNGVSRLNRIMAEIIHGNRDDILVWHDPYRLAPVNGSHEGLDAVSSWTYGHPDIKRLGYTRVLQAAARKHKQKVMQTITLLLYDRFVKPDSYSPEDDILDRSDGKGGFTNGPDYAREALWLVFSQRPDIISFYYASRHYPNRFNQSGVITSPETFDAIGEICRNLIEPYGPAILKCKPRKANVAVLMSAAAIWFRQGPKWYGYPNESILPFCILLMMNQVPFDILFDEDIAEQRLADYDLLIIPYGDALTRAGHHRIVQFAKEGKTVVADTSLQAVVPDAHILDMDFSFMNRLDGRAINQGDAITAEEYQTRMETLAGRLEPDFAGLSRPYRCASRKVLINEVVSEDIRYVFAINDKKAYGPRFGKWKLIQELGVEQAVKIDIRVNGTPTIYDALRRTQAEYSFVDGFAGLNTVLPPARGKLFAILPQPINKVQITGPESARRSNRYAIRIEILDMAGNPVKGAIPVSIDLKDSAGRKTEYSRYATTVLSENGYWGLELPFCPAVNDVSGEWSLKATELLSGKSVEFGIEVE